MGWFVTKEAAQANARHRGKPGYDTWDGPDAPTLDLVIDSFFIPDLTGTELLKFLYQYMVIIRLQKLVIQNCPGCCYKSQMHEDHRVLGCQGQWDILVDTYFFMAVAGIRMKRVEDAFGRICCNSSILPEVEVSAIINPQNWPQVRNDIKAWNIPYYWAVQFKKYVGDEAPIVPHGL